MWVLLGPGPSRFWDRFSGTQGWVRVLPAAAVRSGGRCSITPSAHNCGTSLWLPICPRPAILPLPQAMPLGTAIPNSEWLFYPLRLCCLRWTSVLYQFCLEPGILSILTQCLCAPLLASLTCTPFLIHCGVGCQMTSSSTENRSSLLFPISFSEGKKMAAALSLLHHERNTYPRPSPGGLHSIHAFPRVGHN